MAINSVSVRPLELSHLRANGVENLLTVSNMGIFWGYSNYITSDLTPRKESIMSADHDREVLLARTVDTHVCTQCRTWRLWYSPDPVCGTAKVARCINILNRKPAPPSSRQRLDSSRNSKPSWTVSIGSLHARVYRFNLFPKYHHHLDYYVFQTTCTLAKLADKNVTHFL
jgi:hypothetical protein